MGRKHYTVTLADAIAAHDEALTYGGRNGITSLDLIESALGRPYSGYHRSISRKAAELLQSIIDNHGFVDGNKRTAWLVVELFIERSGYQLAIDDEEPIDDLVVSVAAGKLDFDALHAWFKTRLKRVV